MERKLNLSKVAYCLLIIIFLNLILFAIVFNKNKTSKRENISKTEEKTDTSTKIENVEKKPDITININVAGDIITHNSNFNDAYDKSTDDYDFSYVFDNIEHYFEESDFNIGTLESNFAGRDKGYSNYPTFNAPEHLATDLKELGFDVLATATNHSLDKGFSGLQNTLEELDKAGIAHTGTYATEEESKEYLVTDVKGIKIGILDYDYDTNGIPIPRGKEFCINIIDEEKIKEDIKNIKAKNVDVIIAVMHWGIEYRLTATTEQTQLADFMFSNGVDLILGSHPHCLEPMEKRTISLEDGSTKDGFIIYSLGNFTSGQYQANTRQTALLNIQITRKGDGKISIDSINYTPVFMMNYYSGGKGAHNFKLLDIEAEIERYESGNKIIGEELYNTLKKEVSNIYKVLGPEIN